MTRAKANAIVNDFFRDRNPTFWNGRGSKPSTFNEKVWEYSLTEDIHLEITFAHDDVDGWCHCCDLVDTKSNDSIATLSRKGMDSAIDLVDTIMDLCYDKEYEHKADAITDRSAVDDKQVAGIHDRKPENTMNNTLKAFIDKIQKIGMELYEEYNSLDTGVEYTCPLTDIIDALYAFSCLNADKTIEDNQSFESGVHGENSTDTLEKVKEHFKTINLNRYDLGGCEFVEEDFETIAERVDAGKGTIENVTADYLYEVREILDEGLEDIER